ncbi:hypothetical protein KSS87_000481 [Heliosperma pusillum]|nr:hypothetical protein KSS87_000481 [Heliosperma pusillum]
MIPHSTTRFPIPFIHYQCPTTTHLPCRRHHLPSLPHAVIVAGNPSVPTTVHLCSPALHSTRKPKPPPPTPIPKTSSSPFKTTKFDVLKGGEGVTGLGGRAGQSMNISNLASLNFKSRGIDEDDWLQFRTAVIPTIRDTSSSVRETPSTIKETPPLARRGRSISPSPRTSRLPGSFSFTGSTPKKDDIRSLSPRRFPLLRSGSLASRPTTPKSSRPTTPNTALERQRYLPDAWKSVSMRIHHEKEKPKDIERQPSKSKRLLKALLSRRKSKKDDMLLTYLDEY